MYTPSRFLGALGAGGLAVTFFLWLMFWIPHPGKPIPVFEDWLAAMANAGPLQSLMIITALIGVATFLSLHYVLLIKNLKAWSRFKSSAQGQAFVDSGLAIQRMAVTLTLAMAVNGGFIAGALFVPGLWSVVEYLFPAALVVFAWIGISGLRTYLSIQAAGIERQETMPSFLPVLPGFAFAMVSVGMAAPAAMSEVPGTQMVSIFGSLFFFVLAGFIALSNGMSSFRAIQEKGIEADAMPTLWIWVPLGTVLMIAWLRMSHGLEGLGLIEHGHTSLLLFAIFAAQTIVLMFGWSIKHRAGYFTRLREGELAKPAAYAMICPGVAYAVSIQFLLNKGLSADQIIARFSPEYWVISGFAIVVTAVTIYYYQSLVRKLEWSA